MSVPATCRGGLHPLKNSIATVNRWRSLSFGDAWMAPCRRTEAIRPYEIGMFFVRNHLTTNT
jgi:hypothetical protein